MWKEIPEWSGLYEVSNLGRIKSLRRPHVPSDVIKKPQKTREGYLHIQLANKEIKKCVYIHRVVAEVFIPNPDGKTQVNHKNGNPADNRVNNLEWCTTSENILHSFAELGRQGSQIGNTGANSPHHKGVMQYSKSGCFVQKYDSIKQAAESAGVTSAAIIRACKNFEMSSGGYRWKYE